MTTKVVYVEDDADNFRLVQRILELTGEFEVLGAGDGVSGLELIRRTRPALVLLDLDLPALGGLEVAARIKADPELRATPIVAVSANVMRGERSRCYEAGCLEFVEKPFDIAEFTQLVHDAIAGRIGRRRPR